MWIEAFKSGTQTDSKGNTKDWTNEDLDTIVSKYNDQDEHEAPIVLGHPKDNSPAYGWVQELKRQGDVLMAKIKPTVDDFVDWVKKGVYKKRSISLYGDLTLRHIGFLGGTPPAVKGLADPQFLETHPDMVIQFKDGDQEVQEFVSDNEWNLMYWIRNIGSALKGLRDKIIEEEGRDEADQTIPAHLVDELTGATLQDPVDPVAPFNEDNEDDDMNYKEKIKELEGTITKLETDLTEANNNLATMTADRDAVVTERDQLQQKFADQEAGTLLDDVTAFIDGLIADGCRLTPKDRQAEIENLVMLANIPEADFTEFEGKKINPFEAKKEFLSKLPKQVEFGTVADGTGQVDKSDAKAISKAAEQYRADQKAKGITVTAADAVEFVTSQQ